MSEPATLEPIIYERVESGGWRVPDHERERWENPPRFDKAARTTGEAKPIAHLLAELDAWIYLDDRLEARLREVYDADPIRATRLAESVIEKTQAGGLHSPAGFLSSRLRSFKPRGAPTSPHLRLA